MGGKGSWVAQCTVFAVALGLGTLAVFAAYDVNRENEPSDEALATNLLSHQAGFDELVQMLQADRLSVAAKGASGIDLATVARLDEDPERFRMYRGLLRQISVVDLRYFPDSGKLILIPAGQDNLDRQSKCYLYLPHGQPRPLVSHHGSDWRMPGMYLRTGDRPLKGNWLIHHEMTVEVAVPPY
ncbi:MAG: hypothetical protein ACYDAE_25630 [Steroidobacteraceae bacterium]